MLYLFAGFFDILKYQILLFLYPTRFANSLKKSTIANRIFLIIAKIVYSMSLSMYRMLVIAPARASKMFFVK